MKNGPDIARIGALMGDPARANMLGALLGGEALTASELAAEGGVAAPTASSHLARLVEGGLITPRKQGRHRYYALADGGVAELIEGMMALAHQAGHRRSRPGPRDPALREARVCYDHLAGTRGVALFDSLVRREALAVASDGLTLTPQGARFVADFGIDVAALRTARRPLCLACLDWSARRSHLAGALGAAFLTRFYALGWARRETGARIVRFTPPGARAFEKMVGDAN